MQERGRHVLAGRDHERERRGLRRLREIRCAFSSRTSVVVPIAETTATTERPRSRCRAISATARGSSSSERSTEEPNFRTMEAGDRRRRAHDASRSLSPAAASVRQHEQLGVQEAPARRAAHRVVADDGELPVQHGARREASDPRDHAALALGVASGLRRVRLVDVDERPRRRRRQGRDLGPPRNSRHASRSSRRGGPLARAPPRPTRCARSRPATRYVCAEIAIGAGTTRSSSRRPRIRAVSRSILSASPGMSGRTLPSASSEATPG